MKQIIHISILLLIVGSSTSFAQVTLGRQVIGSTGSFATGTNITVSSTVGEAVTQTLVSSNFVLTQGFQQTYIINDSIVEFDIENETCRGAVNGSIEIINVLGCPGPYTWEVRSVDDTTMILPHDSLATGDYQVLITGGNGCVYPIVLYVGVDSDEDCLLKFYSGITPNGDGRNDTWIIDNIEQFPENTVQIFNRWGNEVWVGENYDNTTVVWDGTNKLGLELPDATFFYVAKIEGIDEIFKGWVELTR